MGRVNAIQTPLISNYAHLVELIQQSQLQVARGSCLICTQGLHFRLLALLSSAACYWLLPIFLSLSSTSSSHPSAFVHLLSTSCCSLISILPTCLSCLCHASVAAQTELCRRAGRAQQDQTSSFCSLHICTTASRAMGWAEQYKRLKGQNEDYDTDAFKKKSLSKMDENLQQ